MIITDWMNEIITYIDSPRDCRTIKWVHDAEGDKEKTNFCKYLQDRYFDAMYFSGGEARNIIPKLVRNEKAPVLCLLDLTNNQRISYDILGQLKSGLVNATKYKGGIKIFDPPHVIVFANFMPDLKALSADRWSIMEI